MSDSPLWRPGRIGPMELKNRVIRSATNEHLSQPDGQLTTAWMDTLVELAENEVGLVITGHMSVDRQQRSDQGQTVLDEQTDLGLLYETARRVHQAGGRIVAQLNHGGKKAPENVNGHPPKLPADFSLEKLDQIVGKYRYAAVRALTGYRSITPTATCWPAFSITWTTGAPTATAAVWKTAFGSPGGSSARCGGPAGPTSPSLPRWAGTVTAACTGCWSSIRSAARTE